MDCDNLKQGPHLVRTGQPLKGRLDRLRPVGIGADQGLRTSADPEALRGTDAELAAGFDDADVERCLDLVRRLWREIAGEATERFASETAHRRAARP